MKTIKCKTKQRKIKIKQNKCEEALLDDNGKPMKFTPIINIGNKIYEGEEAIKILKIESDIVGSCYNKELHKKIFNNILETQRGKNK